MKISHDSETPANGQQKIVVCAFIHKNFIGVEKIFLPRRTKTKKFMPDVFELPGGHVDFGEHLIDALKREVKEEFDTEIEVREPFAAFDYHNKVKGSHSVEIVYFAKFTSNTDNIKLNPEDHSEYVWLAKDELKKMLTNGKNENDEEYLLIKRGFEILQGAQLDFGE